MQDTPLQTLLDRRAGFLSFVNRLVSERAVAEDILQVAYVRALEHVNTLRRRESEESVVAWFYSILRHAVIDHYRRGASEAAAFERYGTETGVLGKNAREPAAPDPSTQKFICGCIERVLPSLRPAYADLLREVDLNEESLAEFARRHKLTPGNAAVRAHRARAALRRALVKFCGSCSIDACLDCVCKEPEKHIVS